MTCSACGTENEASRKFCKECGAPLALICPSCGAPNSADSKYCGECGATLVAGGTAAPPVSASLPSTERRLVSVLFADLVGFTTLSEHRDAEDVRDMLSRYFDAARDAIERHGGLVEKFIGDAVMAVWGTPVAHEDDAERAVRTALELVDAVEALGRDVGLDLRARAGVLTGEAAATVGDTSQGIVTGDLVNTASRLQSAAEPGAVLVGESTYRAASKAIAFADAGELALKGKDEKVHAWRALRVVAEIGGEGRTEAIEPPFVGRAEELRLIKELLHATEREGKARLVSVIGIGGIGKSRLAWEFLKYVDGLSYLVFWHQGRCPAYGDGVTFWALGEMVRMRARIAESDDDAESRRKLSSALHENVPDEDERRWIEPRLLHLLGLAERPAGEREELFSAWRTFFERISEQGPTLMIFEDLQWADPGLLDFIGSMLEWSRNHPILIVTLARPELADKRPNWGAEQRSFTALRLEPLPDDAMREMVRGFVRGLPDDGVDRIVARAEGVPLYAVETVRMLADRGVFEADEDAYELVGDIGTLDQIPETLHALIAARLDALPPDDRALLQDASVLGKSFPVESLASITGQDRATLEPRLRDLVKKEFLIQEGDPRSPERGQYTFLQSLIREVAYGTLSKGDRRAKHLATAHHLESSGDEELAGVVAAHYLEALRATAEGPDAEALAARARDWLSQAADRARSLGSPEQALTYADQALAITPEGRERAEILRQAGEAASDAADLDRAIATLGEAAEAFRALGDPSGVARAIAKMAGPMRGADRTAESLQRMESALADLGEQDDHARAELCVAIAVAHWSVGSFETSLEWTERALPLTEKLDQTELFAGALGIRAGDLFALGRRREALMLNEGLLRFTEEAGNLRERAEALMTQGIFLSEDDPPASLRAELESAEAGRKAGSRVVEAVALANAAEFAVDLGRWSEADAALDALAGMELTGALADGVALSVALLAAFRGDFASADAHLTGRAAESTDFLASRTWYLRTRATVDLLRGDLDHAQVTGMEAVHADPAGMNTPNSLWTAAHAALWTGDATKVREALDATAPLRGRWAATVRTTLEAGLAALEGRSDEASTLYRDALDTWTAMDLPIDHALTTIDAITLLPDDPLAIEAAGLARNALVGLGATPLLERLNAVQRSATADTT